MLLLLVVVELRGALWGRERAVQVTRSGPRAGQWRCNDTAVRLPLSLLSWSWSSPNRVFPSALCRRRRSRRRRCGWRLFRFDRPSHCETIARTTGVVRARRSTRRSHGSMAESLVQTAMGVIEHTTHCFATRAPIALPKR